MSQKLYRQIGKRVRRYRKLAGLTQEQLAEKADLSVHFLGFIERGNAKPTLDSLEQVALALGINVEALFHFPEEGREESQKETKMILYQIHWLLKRCRPVETRMFQNLIQQILETFSIPKRR